MADPMKILIVGAPNSGQREVVELLTGKKLGSGSLEGTVIDHLFKTKYFEADAGLWVDEYADANAWAAQFASDEAKEVREVLAMVIYTVEKEADWAIEGFVAALKADGWTGSLVAIGQSLTKAAEDQLEDLGFDVCDAKELLNTVHTALYDAKFEGDDQVDPAETAETAATGAAADRAEAQAEMVEPLIPIDELDTIVAQLKAARLDPNLSKEEKLKLAQRLAEQLVPDSP